MQPLIRAKTLLRPLAFAAYRVGWRLGQLLRPPRPWDGLHDPVLHRFPPWEGEADGRFAYDFLGVRTDPRFHRQIRPQPPGPLKTDYPRPQYEYIELVFLLDSVLDSVPDSVAAAAEGGGLTVMELGAGYGRWLAAAFRAARLVSTGPVKLIGVEMVPRHVARLHEHLRNNGIDPEEHDLIHAAVSDRDGEAWYRPDSDPAAEYGLSVFRRRVGGAGPAGSATKPSGRETPVRVPCIGLAGLLRSAGTVDLVHCDIQGEELRAIGGSVDELSRRVSRLLVATHSRRIHRRLRALLSEAGWECRHDYRPHRRERTPFGDVQFLDGLLAYVNRSPVHRT
jgi:FkbM family methyltransferase